MSVDRRVPKGYRKAWNGGSQAEAMRLATVRDTEPPETGTPSAGGNGLVHSTWSGPSGIVHGWIPLPEHEHLGYVPVCYPQGNHSGLVYTSALSELDVTNEPITCQRCRKRLGQRGVVVTVRRVLDV